MKKSELDIISECIDSLIEVDMGQVRSAQDDRDAARERKNKAPEKRTFHIKHEDSGKIVSSHSNRPDAMRALSKHGFEDHKIEVEKLAESRINESESTEVVAKNGNHTLSRITRKDGTGYYKLDDKVKADYPIHHAHSDQVAFDKPGQFPKPIVKWASNAVRKHAKAKNLQEAKEVHQVLIDGKLESSHSSEEDAKKRIKQLAFDYKHRTKEPFMAGGKDKKPKIEIRKSLKEAFVLEEDYKKRLSKLGFKEQIPAQTKDGLSGVYRFDHPDYEIEARPKADPAKDFKYRIKDKRTGRSHGSDYLSRVEKFLANKDK